MPERQFKNTDRKKKRTLTVRDKEQPTKEAFDSRAFSA